MAGDNEEQASSSESKPNMPIQSPSMMFAPPAITAGLMPRPDDIKRQSTEEWFRVFMAVAEGLIAIYRNAGQEIVGQRQALATIPALLNRSEGERRLAIRIVTECQSIQEAEQLVHQTVGDLESECQATEAIFNLKRGNMSIEDFYAVLLEKDKKAKLGRTVIIKKLISELPAGVKNTTEKEFRKLRRGLELTGGEIDQIYSVARRAF